MVTYRLADGTAIAGEYEFTGDTEFFEDPDDPLVTYRETWVRVEKAEVTFWPIHGVPHEVCHSEGCGECDEGYVMVHAVPTVRVVE